MLKKRKDKRKRVLSNAENSLTQAKAVDKKLAEDNFKHSEMN